MGTPIIRIDDALESELERIAGARHRTRSELAEEMPRKRIVVERFRALGRAALPFAEAAGYVGDDDIFNNVS